MQCDVVMCQVHIELTFTLAPYVLPRRRLTVIMTIIIIIIKLVPEQVSRFVKYMNRRRKNIKFSFETENNNSFSFLDAKICREKDKFTKSVFRKDTFSGVYTNFSST